MKSEMKKLEDQSLLGDKMNNIYLQGVWHDLEENIFQPLEDDAFSIFKEVEATNVSAVAQAQMLGAAIDKIRSKIKAIINEGTLAKQQIEQIGEEKNG